jgi:hypothetical protein
MNTMSFESADALVEYVNDSTIAQAKIVQIVHKDGRWYLFWYT